MKIQTKRDGEIIEVNSVTIILDDDTSIKIKESSFEKSIEITKIGWEDQNIRIEPCYANQVRLK